MKKILYILFTTGAFLFSACDEEYLNPSVASEEQIINDVNGLISLANGLQYKYSIGRASPNYTGPQCFRIIDERTYQSECWKYG